EPPDAVSMPAAASSSKAELPLTVQLVKVAEPLLTRPPPTSAVLPQRVLSVTRRMPLSLRMPPPETAGLLERAQLAAVVLHPTWWLLPAPKRAGRRRTGWCWPPSACRHSRCRRRRCQRCCPRGCCWSPSPCQGSRYRRRRWLRSCP